MKEKQIARGKPIPDFKKELVEEEDKLKQEVAAAVRKKMAETEESDSES